MPDESHQILSRDQQVVVPLSILKSRTVSRKVWIIIQIGFIVTMVFITHPQLNPTHPNIQRKHIDHHPSSYT